MVRDWVPGCPALCEEVPGEAVSGCPARCVVEEAAEAPKTSAKKTTAKKPAAKKSVTKKTKEDQPTS